MTQSIPKRSSKIQEYDHIYNIQSLTLIRWKGRLACVVTIHNEHIRLVSRQSEHWYNGVRCWWHFEQVVGCELPRPSSRNISRT